MGLPHLGGPEVALILVVILIVFGVGKLPQVGSAMGKGIRAFRRGQGGEEEEEEAKPKPRTKKATATTRKRATKV